jgi:hypothetical protein
MVLRTHGNDVAQGTAPLRDVSLSAGGVPISTLLSGGKQMVTVVPAPGTLSIASVPSCALTSALANGRPKPTPSKAPRKTVVELFERFERMADAVGVHAYAGIGDRDRKGAVCGQARP